MSCRFSTSLMVQRNLSNEHEAYRIKCDAGSSPYYHCCVHFRIDSNFMNQTEHYKKYMQQVGLTAILSFAVVISSFVFMHYSLVNVLCEYKYTCWTPFRCVLLLIWNNQCMKQV